MKRRGGVCESTRLSSYWPAKDAGVTEYATVRAFLVTLAGRVSPIGRGEALYHAMISSGWELLGYDVEPAQGGGADRPERWHTIFRRKKS